MPAATFGQRLYKLGTEHREVDREASQSFSEEGKLCGFLSEKRNITFHGRVSKDDNRCFSKVKVLQAI